MRHRFHSGVNAMSVRSTILEQFERVAQEQDKPITTFNDETALLESGLDSVCFAIIIASLEDILGVDPFFAAGASAFPVTVGDFIDLYERAVP
jgi:acyl carrier protein